MSRERADQNISAEEFTYAFRHHPAGVAIVTADAGDGPVAMTVSSVASVSIDPPTLVFSASARSSSTPTIARAETLIVHMLASDQVQLAKLGARSGAERFGEDIEWDRLPSGEPYYPRANSWIRGRVADRFEVRDATLVVVEAIGASPRRADGPCQEPNPLVYHNRKWFVLDRKSMLPESLVPFYVVYGRGD
ncbi:MULTISPECIES: flavin reductase family protein [Microbacterium]|jgi:flavin reductase (DIM6/NTAB) family NADH-FMN oxidoreductase RutF|uniref:flavin reductase family protein n=1 Tax=Microbacterium TaxID=33882 RepID=UPI0003A4A19E|nr:flavin reductase family protein [Microbacterium schleiferi]MCC4268789.1 flavin reductase family protein [Microbacterium schleiferi]